MKNPWTKKNPWMSMYLSGANAVAGSVRGSATAAAKRQTTRSINSGIRQVTEAWTNAFLPSSSSSRKGRRR